MRWGEPMTTDESVRPGDTLGRYELLSCVGRGGMAAVWAARHRGAHGFSKIVAVKTMLPELSDDPEFQRMFLAEARVAARIHHPNVVETLDLGEEEGLLYLVMEWMDGETLSSIMKTAFLQGGVPMPIALKLIIDACAGAHAAHELSDDDNRPMGLVHRDVSPPNVLVSYSGHVKLADFGVAKTLDVNNGGTQTGQVKGKFRYMAPEQLLGAPIDRRVDIFALGIGLYQLTTGRHPWPGDTAAVTMQRILSEKATSPASFVEGYPAPLEAIVLKALDRNPAERFQTAADFAETLEEFARSAGAVATNRDVGAYVTHLLGSHGAARRDRLRNATREADSRSISLRDTAKQLRQIDATWDPPPAAVTSTELAQAGPSNDVAEVLSLRPWSATESAPPAARDTNPDGRSSTLSTGIVRVLSFVPRSGRSKPALLIGAAVVLMTGAYALGGHRSSDVAAAATTFTPEGRTVVATGAPDPISPDPTTATPESPPASARSAPPSASNAPRRDHARRPPPPVAPHHKPALPPPEQDSEPDVGY